MIVMRTPKGWTGPKTVDGKKTEGYVAQRTRFRWRGWTSRPST